MVRRLGAASEIRIAVEDRLAGLLGADEARGLRIPEPQRCDADESGCNWSMDYRSSCGEHEEAIHRAVTEAQARWNLRD